MKTTDTELLSQAIDVLKETLLQKRESYGNAFNNAPSILKMLYPDGIPPEAYSDVLTIIRISDKLHRIANFADTEDPWKDIAGYAVLEIEKSLAQKQNL
jgi:hypothetical protein